MLAFSIIFDRFLSKADSTLEFISIQLQLSFLLSKHNKGNLAPFCLYEKG